MEFLKKQGKNAWVFYKTYLFKTHLWCMAVFLALCALSAWVLGNFYQQAEAIIRSFVEEILQSGLLDEQGNISMGMLLGNNLQATFTAVMLGIVPFVFLPVFSLALNAVVVGAAVTLSGISGLTVWQMVILGLLPHGIFEIPAIMLGVSMGLYLCSVMNGTLRKRPGTPRIEAVLPRLAGVFLFGVVPLLTVAAVVETALTPLLLGLVL